jgi:hypothetical protein
MKITKELVRETFVTDRRLPIMIELHPHHLRIWPKGTRESYSVPWDYILDRARLNDARLKLAEKLKLKKRA